MSPLSDRQPLQRRDSQGGRARWQSPGVRVAAVAALFIAVIVAALSPHAPAFALSPSLVWPPNGWTVDTVTPALRWSTAGYTHLVVRRDGSDIPAIDTILGSGIDSYVPAPPLSSGTTYRWRIRSNPLSPSQSPYTWTSWTGEWTFKTTGPPPSWASASFVALAGPVNGAMTDRVNPTLSFRVPAGSRQIEFVLIPSYNTSATMSVVGPVTNEITLSAPPVWYGMLPGTTYYWRVRATDETIALPPDHPAWSGWSETWSFRTPHPSGTTAYAVTPYSGQLAGSLTPTLVWGDTEASNFYYEVQMSRDPNFVTDPQRATAMVYWEIRHGGVTSPRNSYTVPREYPLYPGVNYYWRVRQRTGDNGSPVGWSPTWSFISPGASGIASIPAEVPEELSASSRQSPEGPLGAAEPATREGSWLSESGQVLSGLP